MTIGSKIKNLREDKKMTQVDLATASKITQGQLSEYENDHVIPPIKKLDRIANALGVSVAVLDESLLNVCKRAIEGNANTNGSGNAADGYGVMDGQSPVVDVRAEIESFRAGLIMQVIALDIEPGAKDAVLKIIATYNKKENDK